MSSRKTGDQRTWRFRKSKFKILTDTVIQLITTSHIFENKRDFRFHVFSTYIHTTIQKISMHGNA